MKYKFALAVAMAIMPLSAAQADIVTIGFSGTGTSFIATNVIAGTVTYDDRVLSRKQLSDANPFYEINYAEYSDPTAVMDFTINGQRFTNSVLITLTTIMFLQGGTAPDGYMQFVSAMPTEQLAANLVFGWNPSPFGAFAADRTLGETASLAGAKPLASFLRFDTPSQSTAYRLDIDYTVSSTPSVPEPESWALMIAGLAITGAALRGRRAARRVGSTVRIHA